MTDTKHKLFSYFALATIVLLYLFDIGNLNGLRQGTEGFYLQIAKEMFNENSILTPLYMGENHWSKPPFQFWLAMSFYKVFGEASLFASRLSIAILTFLSLYLFATWSKRNFNLKFTYSLLFFASCYCFYKYGRIFMMEVPLACLTSIGVLHYYDYKNSDKIKFLLSAAIFTGLSILVKGPVSLVMTLGGVGLYYFVKLLNKDKVHFKKLFFWISLATIISSIWFILCYIKYGNEFFDYFFLRENVGKFTAKSYPIRHVFQGLLIYALPWSLFVPFIYFYVKDNFKKLISGEDDKFLFLLCNFVFFFTLWLIPSQRSHHYAVPSIPFFLLMILYCVFNPKVEIKRLHLYKYTNHLIVGFLILLIFILGISLTLEEIYGNFKHLSAVLLTILGCCGAIYFYIQKSKNEYKFFTTSVVIGLLWSVLIPSFALPLIPGTVVDKVGNNKVATVVKKPYFASEALGQEVTALHEGELYQYVQENRSYYITKYSVFTKLKLEQDTEVLETWYIWKRRRRMSHIIDALKVGKIMDLKEKMVLFKNKD